MGCTSSKGHKMIPSNNMHTKKLMSKPLPTTIESNNTIEIQEKDKIKAEPVMNGCERCEHEAVLGRDKNEKSLSNFTPHQDKGKNIDCLNGLKDKRSKRDQYIQVTKGLRIYSQKNVSHLDKKMSSKAVNVTTKDNHLREKKQSETETERAINNLSKNKKTKNLDVKSNKKNVKKGALKKVNEAVRPSTTTATSGSRYPPREKGKRKRSSTPKRDSNIRAISKYSSIALSKAAKAIKKIKTAIKKPSKVTTVTKTITSSTVKNLKPSRKTKSSKVLFETNEIDHKLTNHISKAPQSHSASTSQNNEPSDAVPQHHATTPTTAKDTDTRNEEFSKLRKDDQRDVDKNQDFKYTSRRILFSGAKEPFLIRSKDSTTSEPPRMSPPRSVPLINTQNRQHSAAVPTTVPQVATLMPHVRCQSPSSHQQIGALPNVLYQPPPVYQTKQKGQLQQPQLQPPVHQTNQLVSPQQQQPQPLLIPQQPQSRPPMIHQQTQSRPPLISQQPRSRPPLGPQLMLPTPPVPQTPMYVAVPTQPISQIPCPSEGSSHVKVVQLPQQHLVDGGISPIQSKVPALSPKIPPMQRASYRLNPVSQQTDSQKPISASPTQIQPHEVPQLRPVKQNNVMATQQPVSFVPWLTQDSFQPKEPLQPRRSLRFHQGLSASEPTSSYYRPTYSYGNSETGNAFIMPRGDVINERRKQHNKRPHHFGHHKNLIIKHPRRLRVRKRLKLCPACRHPLKDHKHGCSDV